jgi:UDP-N-acetylmuramoyl-tripeptide--D-alanyl-D-alanine ligase
MSALWSAADLLEATGGAMAVPFDADGVSIDTRSLAPGDLFIALRGETGDGHDHVAAAIAKGASGAMVHRLIPGKTRLLLVDDTLAALARLGGFGRSRFAGRVVAITGSVGKTTTKEMLRRILVAVGPTHAAVASYNNHWGLPLTLARLPVDAAFCVAEIGMNHAGEIAPLARLARPHVALITAVERAHIGFLGSIEAIAEEKAAILQGLEPGGIAVLPADNTQFPRLRAAAGKAPMITFGTQHGVDARLIEVATDAAGSDLTASVVGHDVALRLNAPGRHMAMNAVAALAAAAALGLDVPAAAQALSGFSAVAGRGARRLIAMPGGSALLLDESYNGNGASMRAALSVLRLQPASRRIAVLGDMLELGDAGPAEHAALAPDIIAAADLLYACGPLMRLVYDAMPAKLRAAHAPDAATLSEIVARAVAPGDAILVKGSLGSRMKQVVTALDALAEAA